MEELHRTGTIQAQSYMTDCIAQVHRTETALQLHRIGTIWHSYMV